MKNVYAAVVGLVLLLPGVARAAESPPHANIIFLLADDAGYGDFGCYGQQRIKTPNIDRMATEGMRFTQFYAGATVCSPSRATLMTGLHNGHGWIRANDRGPGDDRRHRPALDEQLRGAHLDGVDNCDCRDGRAGSDRGVNAVDGDEGVGMRSA